MRTATTRHDGTVLRSQVVVGLAVQPEQRAEYVYGNVWERG